MAVSMDIKCMIKKENDLISTVFLLQLRRDISKKWYYLGMFWKNA